MELESKLYGNPVKIARNNFESPTVQVPQDTYSENLDDSINLSQDPFPLLPEESHNLAQMENPSFTFESKGDLNTKIPVPVEMSDYHD